MSCCRPVTGACVHAAALSEAPKQQRNALRSMQTPPRHLPGCRFEGHPPSTYHARAAPPSFDIDESRAGPTRAARPAPPRYRIPVADRYLESGWGARERRQTARTGSGRAFSRGRRTGKQAQIARATQPGWAWRPRIPRRSDAKVGSIDISYSAPLALPPRGPPLPRAGEGCALRAASNARRSC